MGKDIKPATTISAIEQVVKKELENSNSGDHLQISKCLRWKDMFQTLMI